MSNELIVKTSNGYFKATPSQDPNYPGIDIEFIADDARFDDLCHPRVLFEKPVDTGELRALAWNDPKTEDFTQEILFNKFIPVDYDFETIENTSCSGGIIGGHAIVFMNTNNHATNIDFVYIIDDKHDERHFYYADGTCLTNEEKEIFENWFIACG